MRLKNYWGNSSAFILIQVFHSRYFITFGLKLKHMKISFLLLMLIGLANFGFAQGNDSTATSTDGDSYYMDFSNKKTYFNAKYLQWSDAGFRILKTDKNGNPIINSGDYIKAKDVKRLKYGNRIYLNLKGEYGRNNLIAVVAYSDKYILGFEDSGQKSLYVYDRDENVIMKRTMVNNKKYYKKAYTKIQFYFQDCAEFLSLFSAFIEQYKGYDADSVIAYISMYKCNGKDLFED